MDIAQSQPRFRTDLVAQPIEEGGQRFVDVTDPDSGKTFRFYDIEYSIACAMDGQRDIMGLADWAQSELGLEPSPDELETVISTLAELGYLDDGPRGADIDLGHAGASELDEPDSGPAGIDVELGVAGNELGEPGDDDDDVVTTSSMALGGAGNESVIEEEEEEEIDEVSMHMEVEEEEQSFATLLEEDEQETSIKAPEQVFATRGPASEQRLIPEAPLPPMSGSDMPEPKATLRPIGGSDADEDGPTNLPPPASDFDDEVSVDLTDHLHLGPEAVKEAVRQSRMMPSSDPDDQEDQLEELAPASFGQDRPIQLPDKAISIGRPLESADDQLGTPLPPQKSNLGLMLLALLLVIVVAAAAVFLLDLGGIKTKLGFGDSSDNTSATNEPETPEPETPPPPKKVELPTATLELAEGEAMEIKSAQTGVIASIFASGTEVGEEDIVAKLQGMDKLEKKVAAAKGDQNRYERRIEQYNAKREAAEAAGNTKEAEAQQKEIDKQQAKITGKQKEIDEAEAEMEAFLLKAPTAGVVETSFNKGSRVAADQVVFTVKTAPLLQAVFTISVAEDQKPAAKGAEVQVVAKEDENKTLECAVTSVEGDKVTVKCPSDGEIAPQTQVILRP